MKWRMDYHWPGVKEEVGVVRSVYAIEGQGDVCGVTHTHSGDLDTLIEAVILNYSTLGRGESVQHTQDLCTCFWLCLNMFFSIKAIV